MKETYKVFMNGKFSGTIRVSGSMEIRDYIEKHCPKRAKYEIDKGEKTLSITISLWDAMESAMKQE